VQLDPKFAVAWAALSVAYFDVYSADHTPQRLADAKHAIDTAFQLQPDLGEAYMALGIYRTRVLRDYDGALEAFEKAGERGVNRAMTADFSSYVKRRQGKWEESLALSAQAGDSDPRNTNILVGRAQTYRALRRFKEAHTTLARALEITPAEPQLLALNAEVYQAEGNLKAARALLLAVPADGRDPAVFFIQFQQWGFERRYSDAIKTLSAILSAPQPMAAYQIASYRMLLGFAELCDGEQTAGRSDLIKARDQLERMQKEGDEGPRLTLHLTLINGALHDKEAVERYVSRIQEEISKDAMNGPSAATIVATARAALGENDAAIAALSDLLKIPGQSSLTPALLRLDPAWDPLRKYPRFQKLANSQP
jgi:tetratricopeptide (TPR) repeat protein